LDTASIRQRAASGSRNSLQLPVPSPRPRVANDGLTFREQRTNCGTESKVLPLRVRQQYVQQLEREILSRTGADSRMLFSAVVWMSCS
jgi:hypothetical protein